MRKPYPRYFTTAIKNPIFKLFAGAFIFLMAIVPRESFAAGPTIFTIGNPTTAVGAANICAGSLNVPIHAFTIAANGNSGSANLTNFLFTTTGNYTAAEIVNFKIWYNTT